MSEIFHLNNKKLERNKQNIKPKNILLLKQSFYKGKNRIITATYINIEQNICFYLKLN